MTPSESPKNVLIDNYYKTIYEPVRILSDRMQQWNKTMPLIFIIYKRFDHCWNFTFNVQYFEHGVHVYYLRLSYWFLTVFTSRWYVTLDVSVFPRSLNVPTESLWKFTRWYFETAWEQGWMCKEVGRQLHSSMYNLTIHFNLSANLIWVDGNQLDRLALVK